MQIARSRMIAHTHIHVQSENNDNNDDDYKYMQAYSCYQHHYHSTINVATHAHTDRQWMYWWSDSPSRWEKARSYDYSYKHTTRAMRREEKKSFFWIVSNVMKLIFVLHSNKHIVCPVSSLSLQGRRTHTLTHSKIDFVCQVIDVWSMSTIFCPRHHLRSICDAVIISQHIKSCF